MSLQPTPIPPVPEDTARVVRAVFPRGNVLMQLRDTLGTMYSDEAFAGLFPTHGSTRRHRGAWHELSTVFQFMEHLTDRQADDAVRVPPTIGGQGVKNQREVATVEKYVVLPQTG